MPLNKYGIDYPKEVIDTNIQRLSNQIWKCIPMKENNEDWNKQLNTVVVEIAGLHEIFMSPQYLQIQDKLEGLLIIEEVDFATYRKTIFDCLNLLQELKRDED